MTDNARIIGSGSPNLDDHRQQAAQVPRVETTLYIPPPQTPLATRRSTINQDRPGLLHVDLANGMTVRDFEHAIIDDERSAPPSPGGQTPLARRPSQRGRRNAFRRNTRDDSSSGSSSPSPPNSVHAFADQSRRRERANTVTSRRSSVDLALHRTTSGETHRRRPTFSESKDDDAAEGSSHASAEDDVCYPQSDDGRSDEHRIDFEELHEFVEETELGRSGSVVGKGKVATPDRTESPPPKGSDVDLSDLEKLPQCRATSADRRSVENVRRFWTFFSSELDDTIHATTIGGLLEDGESFEGLFRLGPDGGCWWLDAVNPTDEEVTALCKAFGVHPLTREDITTKESREKVELFKTYYFVSFTSFHQMDKTSEDYMEAVKVFAVVFREGLLTFSFDAHPHTKNVCKRISRLRDYMQLSADWICYALIDDIVDTFMPVIRDVEVEADNIEDQVFIATSVDASPILRAISDCRKKAMSLLRLLGSKPDVIKGFAKRCNEQYESAPRGDVGLYLSDIQDHVMTMRDNLTHTEQVLSRLHANFLGQLNVESLQQGNNINKVFSTITLVGTILVPLNLVTGLFGMNVPVPGRDSGGLAWFFGIVGFLVFFVLFMILLAKRLRFI
ncbi:cora-domain-containing protein [Trichodelitschia bisporula]|uniref:Cora-domain-containing protein n=1 Tax=Trichodelitschia bisporula TaxID=703511 RepID=A0A6G1I7V0_9PEZI|nr:cora-domain-containing protein [Trichodelitschia bisporula]